MPGPLVHPEESGWVRPHSPGLDGREQGGPGHPVQRRVDWWQDETVERVGPGPLYPFLSKV